MIVGFEVYGPNSDIRLGLTERISRFIGEVTTGTSIGSISNSELLQGTPWYALIDTTSEPNGMYPTVTIAGSVLSWSWGPNVTRLSSIIVYGVY